MPAAGAEQRRCWRSTGWHNNGLWTGAAAAGAAGFASTGAAARRGRTGSATTGAGARSRSSSGQAQERRRHSGLHARRSGGRFFRRLSAAAFCFGRGFGFGQIAKVLAHPFRGFHLNRTGMRLFFGDSGFGQIVDNALALTSSSRASSLMRI